MNSKMVESIQLTQKSSYLTAIVVHSGRIIGPVEVPQIAYRICLDPPVLCMRGMYVPVRIGFVTITLIKVSGCLS